MTATDLPGHLDGWMTSPGGGRDRNENMRTMPFAGPDPTGPAEEQVERLSVNTLLNRAAKRRVCFVIGAAGWGKSTAVATWSRSHPTAWLRCEDHDRDADRLLARMVGALREHEAVPVSRRSAAPVDTGTVDSTVAAVCAYLHTVLGRDLVLVLDDLHELQPESDAAGVVESLCQQAPDRLHLVLISRYELPFSLQRLWGRGLVSEIPAQDLAFTVADVETLLRKTVGENPPGLPRQVWEHTGGWPTAVQCAVEMLRGITEDQRLATVEKLCQPGERFYDYLAEEVVGVAPDWARQLWWKLAIFGGVSPTTENSPGLDDQTTLLAELARQGLVRRSGEDRAGWALVRPLQDFFEHEGMPSTNERTALHRSAATEYIERGALADALRHLQAAGDHAKCASLLVRHGAAMVENCELDAVLQATGLPADYLDDPRLHLVLGQARQVRGQWAQALQHFQRAIRHRDELEPALSWRVGSIAFAEGEFADVQAVVRRTQAGREDTLDETRVLALSASAYRATGDLAGLRRMAIRTHAAARRCNDPRAWSSAYHVLALLAAAEGNWLQADVHCTDAQHRAEASGDLLQLTWTWTCRAFHQFEAGAPRHAQADAQTALSLSERCENPFFTAHALTTRGRARARLGMLEAGAADFASAIDLFRRIGSRFLAWPLCGLADVHRTKGQLARARAAYEEALTLADPHHDVFGLSSALIGLARIAAADDLAFARECAGRAVELGEGLRAIPAVLTRGWVELIGGDRERASADAHQAAVAARIRRDDPGLAEALTLAVLASPNPAKEVTPLREAIDIWHETGCRLEEAATRTVADRIGAPIPHLDAYLADRTLRDQGVDVERRRAAGPLGVLARTAGTVFIQTLGGFRVIRDGVPIPHNEWKSKKARDLLKIMVARRRLISRDQLMELLWPGANSIVSNNRLSVLLSKVRDVLQPQLTGVNPLVATDGALSLDPVQIRVDVEEFLTQATAALDADRAKEPDGTARLTAAVAAYTGDFLQGDPYQEWASALGEEVRAIFITLLRALVARLDQASDTDAVVYYTLRLLEQDPYDENAHITLIKVQVAAGHLGEAHRHHQTYVRRMTEINVRARPLSWWRLGPPTVSSRDTCTRAASRS